MNPTPHSLVEELRPLKAAVSGQYRVGGPDEYPMLNPEDFYYIYHGVVQPLNFTLAQRNKCSSNDMWNIIILHHYRIEVMDKFCIAFGKAKKQELVQELEDIEYDLQFFWHFPMDHNYHNYWWRVEGCKCSFGKFQPDGETRVISLKCPLHNSELYHV